MSATNRGSKRLDSDFYVTPENTINALLKNIKHIVNPYNPCYKILEPSAGNGAICKALKEHFQFSMVVANEIRKEENDKLQQCADFVYNYDFMEYPNDIHYDMIITNPPYSMAQEFVEKAMQIAKPNTNIIMLLRLGFLESKKRYNFWQRYPLTELYVLSERPKFINNSSDATAYGWFVWNKMQTMQTFQKNQVIKVIK